LHPLAIARVEAVVDLCTALGWLPRSEYCESPCATPAQLRWFHDADYIRALRDASATGSVDVDTRRRYGIGTMENPLFPGVFERASTSIGGSIRAAELALEGKIAFHPAGGTHHGRPDRASGFCYFNDPVFAILRLLQGGLERILYVDLDAHHGDGVQDAFANESRVHTISIHESGRWPHTGAVTDTGTGRACNAPVPSNFHDAEFALLVDSIVLPLAARVEPDAVVVTCGGDALAGDPLTSMALSNVALWDTVLRLAACAPAVVVLGGGGYNPWTLTRYWAGLWGRLSGRTIPALLTEPAKQVLQRLRCDLIDDEDVRPEWLCRLADVPAAKPVRSAVRSLCEQLLAQNGIERGRVRRSTSVGKDALEPEPNRVARAAGQRAMIAGGRR
jgi:acetoin utilization protein AcuC